MQKLRILILHPDPVGLSLLTAMLKSLGHIIEEAVHDVVAIRLMERNDIDLLLAVVDPVDADALELLTYVRRKHREVPVVLLFPRIHPERAREALRVGAMTVLKYPVPAAELRAAVLQALEQREIRTGAAAQSRPATSPAPSDAPTLFPMEADGWLPSLTIHPGGPEPETPSSTASSADALTAAVLAVYPLAPRLSRRIAPIARELGLIGNDPSWRQVLDLAATVAPARASVLIVGEPGTGKSLVARLLHSLGPGAQRPFVILESSAMADALLASEVENPGSTNPGLVWQQKLNQVRGGTLYLDQVGSLPMEIQLNLLWEMQYRDYGAMAAYPQRIGEARFVMSTSENLPALIDQGHFCQELFHRVSAISLMLPPLRHRGTDVELLADAFRARYAREFHKSVAGFTRDALDILRRHDWPGNVRELEAAVRRAVAICDGPRITEYDLTPMIHHQLQSRTGATTPRHHLAIGIRSLNEAVEEAEKRIIIQALQTFNWNRQQTASVLKIERSTLCKKMKKYGLFIDDPIWTNEDSQGEPRP